MPVPTPFHPRTSALCTSLRWKEWAGYHAVCSYDTCHETEYHSFRQAAGVLDVTPLQKYDVTGPDAARFLAFLMVRDVTKLKQDQVWYTCWCDERGKVVDDGTVTKLDDGFFRVTAAEPSLSWFARHARGFDVQVVDRSAEIAALAVQGPRAREVLSEICDADLDSLRFFRAARCRLAGREGLVTRTGYTGDLGYELWIENDGALPLWDALFEAGRPYRLQPAGLDALDVTRMEAGFILGGVDYVHALRAWNQAETSSPFELGLGWMVRTRREPFLGQAALQREERTGSAWSLVGVVADWDAFEALHDEVDLPPHTPAGVWRDSTPIYDDRRQVGYATSGAWSPQLKQLLALATLESEHAELGTELRLEVKVFHRRRTVPVVVTATPFFDPDRKTSCPAREPESSGARS